MGWRKLSKNALVCFLWLYGIGKKKSLKLARDRIGEKPLYYGFCGKGLDKSFVFSSELSSFKALEYFKNGINAKALSQLINYGSVSAPNSIFEDIFQLIPGTILTLNSPIKKELSNLTKWWSLNSVVEKSFSNQIHTESEAILILEKVLKQSIKGQSIADVPLGTFLSGGIDSSLITSLLQSESKRKVKTFTIGFEDGNFNEAPLQMRLQNT